MKRLVDLREAVERSPGAARPLFELGLAFARRGEITEALDALRDAVRLEPETATYHRALGHVLVYGRTAIAEAVECFERALRLDPGWKSCAALGWLYATALDQALRARPLCVRAISERPDDYAIYSHLARSFLDVPTTAAMEARMMESLPPQAELDLVPLSFATALSQVGRYEAAREVLVRARDRYPRHGHITGLLGMTEAVLGNDDAARQLLDRARELEPENGPVRTMFLTHAWRHGDFLRVKQTMYSEGIAGNGAEAEASARAAEAALAGQTILIKEMPNGYGDTIQWSRVASVLRARGARVVLEGRTALRRLLSSVSGTAQVVIPYDDYPACDTRLQPFQLPPGVDWSWEELGRTPYLDVPADVQRVWDARVAAEGDGLHVGVEWGTKGNSVMLEKDDPYIRRAMPFEALGEIFTVPALRTHALHKGGLDPHEQRIAPASFSTRLAEQIEDFLDTAAMISALDAVVTVDTAVAHVAGALGKPTLVMVPSFAEWRWGHEGPTVPWYPSARVFRQHTPGDWKPVVAEVADALRALAAARDRRRSMPSLTESRA